MVLDTQAQYRNEGGNEQYTPYYAVELIIPYIQHFKDKIIWCPCDKDESEFVKVLRENGFTVVNSHIDYGQDFFKYEPEKFDVILTNPPYENKRAFIERAESFNKPYAFLLPATIINDSILNDIYGDMSEMTCLIPDKRIRFFNNAKGEVGTQPTFKAAYIGRNFFTKQIIGVKIPKGVYLSENVKNLNLF